MAYRFIGKSLARTEDARLLRGFGRYTADLAPAHCCRMYVVRSPHAAARFAPIATEAASACEGVRLVLTAKEAEVAALGPFTSRIRRTAPDGSPSYTPPYRALARDEAKFVGDPVAAIFADTLDQAKTAAEKLDIAWTPLPAVADTRRASEPGMPQLWPEAPRNICFVHDAGDPAAVDAALARAAHTITISYPVNRVVAAPMEPRAALAHYDAGMDSFTLYAGLQNPHYNREELAERVMHIPGNRLRVVAPDVGGGFGMKESPFPEYPLVLIAARRLDRPVLWVAERTESFVADHHARDAYTSVTLGLDKDGTFLALKVDTTSNLGAYLAWHGLIVPVNNLGGLSGVYRTPHIHAHVTGVFSNTPPTSPYRGAGRPEAIYAIERAIDVAAKRLGFDRIELRRRNMIAPDQMPYQTGFMFTYDSGEFERNMDDVLALSDWAGFPQRRRDALRRGKLAGIGLANPIEIAGGPITGPWPEAAEIRFDSTGAVTVTLGTHSHGQGHEITFAQIVGDLLGVDVGDVKIAYGDTDRLQHGTGTMGSRSVAAGSITLIKTADRIVARGKKIAAAHFEAAESDIVFEAGMFSVAGTDRRIDIAEVARLSFRLSPKDIGGELGLSAGMMVMADGPTFPNGSHVCEVEIDPETGRCAILRYCVVDDVGRAVNPMLVEGQIHGGVVQGVGQILGEDLAYDTEGQLLSGSFMDYAMPRAAGMPDIESSFNEVLAKSNPLGVKGAGEAGTVGALATLTNAIVDALAPLGIEHIDMPATSERIWRAIDGRRAQLEALLADGRRAGS
jgi:aerobic carbon-monoxide dehydrogenase large subunit